MNAESCIRCGSCKALCPTQAEDASESMGGRGRVILAEKFLSGEIEVSERLKEILNSCILCGACNSLCPLGINVTDTVYECRKAFRRLGDKKNKFLSFIAGSFFKNPATGFRTLKFLEGIGEILPLHLFQPFRTLRELGVAFPDHALRDGMSIFKVLKPRGRIAVFAGCTVNFLYPSQGRSLIKSLNALNYDVILPKGEICCGAPLMSLGLAEDAAELAEKNLNIFKKMNVEAVIGLCPTCVNFIKNEYRKIIGDGMDNALELSQFFNGNLPGPGGGSVPKPETRDPKPKVLYHAPCHSRYNLNVRYEPGEILKSLGLDVIEPAGEGCCGFGGTFRLSYPELSDGILERRKAEYRKADVIVTSCPNCIIQLRSKIKDRPVRHLIEIIEEGTV